MNRLITLCFALTIFVCLRPIPLSAQPTTDEEAETLIERLLAVDKTQRDAIKTVSFEAEYIEGEYKDDQFKEKLKLEKNIYIKYGSDTTLFAEEYVRMYKDSKEKSEKDLIKEAHERTEKKQKRRQMDISYNMLTPFYADHRDVYDIKYIGVNEEDINGYTCHHFTVSAIEESDTLINGDYFIDSETFCLVRVDFSPAKLVKKTMFKMKELKMSLRYGPGPDGYWLPKQFDISGKGKAMFFIGVKFAGTEYYHNPQINIDLDDKFREGEDGSDKN